ncbi:bifunctional biotin--[acetyl-CoA-carboxylase] ligase/biotin operon repressor BirA [Candidatus Palibaumannia cicadellinicola]|uniref:biotin--[biotin carboxyl-carrier protein] ligase n=1 Tax=Candidatus Palibaumannia cicadellinicola TaxID=186490 RepID=A0A0K2BLH9_9GAMM|nr:bifunctional biotin--[acetyl-CoA-carboxylase] ligase/biotin operon repressor BirA [Candidatus Baumannia cicadellinicola]AKZ66037.1 bifunctional protein biotin operon repressor and biotin-acetyl-CoA carboxylase synthase [Candidatus Baumannia cicadellinicola]
MQLKHYYEHNNAEINCSIQLINILSPGNIYSSEQLSQKLNISLQDVNKYIAIVRNWGVDLITYYNKYYLKQPLYLLDNNVIKLLLYSGRLEVLTVINSTNQYLINKINHLNIGDACVAEYQLNGRGRCGKKWFSSFGKNIYLSIYWRLKKHEPTALIGLSLMVGIIVAEILQTFGVSNVKLKWPNDIYLNNRKLAGILVEMTGMSSSDIHVVMGIGINLALPTSISTTWISLQDIGIVIIRNHIVAALTNALRNSLLIFEKYGLSPFLLRWHILDYFYNQPIQLIIGNVRSITGIYRGINSSGALLLEEQGKIKEYLSGNISISLLEKSKVI